MLRPAKHTQKLLISTTSRFVGEYVHDRLLLTHSWEIGNMQDSLQENPHCKNYYVVAFDTSAWGEKGELDYEYLDYDPYGELICTYLSVLFGKRFDYNGLIEANGMFYRPRLETGAPLWYPTMTINSHRPRSDVSIALNLANVKMLQPILVDDIGGRAIEIASAAGEFYSRSLRTFEIDPDMAFLDLVTCGEILANYYEYTDEEIYDERLRTYFQEIEARLEKGTEISTEIKSRLYQVRRRFSLTLTKLLKDDFFDRPEGTRKFVCLHKDSIERRIKAAYDLRSRYVHEGQRFGQWLRPHCGLWDDERDSTGSSSCRFKGLSETTLLGAHVYRYGKDNPVLFFAISS